jgi:predicted O-methyltransferase YrrM
VRNVFACLVHESPECVIDLVRNLRHLDPTSVVLLYNGGNDPDLLARGFPFERYGAVIHPSPRPLRWGRLHDFAIDCMRFALDSIPFDTMTIVDSDQLAVRPGYSQALARWLADRPRAGLLGNAPARLALGTQVGPAKAAWQEVELWRPFLARFPDGEAKFVHWTFWPSTVFTAAAARDLVRIFSEDAQLRELLEQSKIWASEEVILPTLVALLGHEVAASPCSYDYVKYRTPYTMPQLSAAMSRPDVFWAHPIPRRYEDPLRNQVRVRFRDYPRPTLEPEPDAVVDPTAAALPPPRLLRTLPILASMRRVEGWLSDEEADLLIAATARALGEHPGARAIVEVGSYCGRATVVLASVVKAVRPEARVWSIDPHDGKLGAADQLIAVGPSLEKLKANLAAAGLAGLVEVIRSTAGQVAWSEPIGLLLIDGLHDYTNVARDFYHFEPWLAEGSSVAFHDYASYFPGVVTFVDELAASGYHRVDCVDSLIVLQRRGRR